MVPPSHTPCSTSSTGTSPPHSTSSAKLSLPWGENAAGCWVQCSHYQQHEKKTPLVTLILRYLLSSMLLPPSLRGACFSLYPCGVTTACASLPGWKDNNHISTAVSRPASFRQLFRRVANTPLCLAQLSILRAGVLHNLDIFTRNIV